MSVGFVKTIIDAIAASGKKNTEEEIRHAIVNDGTRFAGANVGLIKTEADKIPSIIDKLAGGVKNTEQEIRDAVVNDDTRFAGANVGLIKAEADTIKSLVDAEEAAGPYSYTDAGGEQAVYEDVATTRRRIWIEVSNRWMTKAGTFRIYRKVDGTNYDLWIEQAVTVGAGDERVFDSEFTTNQPWEITYEEDADEGSDRAIPFNVITQIIE